MTATPAAAQTRTLARAAVGRPGPVAVITGGSSGIGHATALLFARQGWQVGLVARGEAGLRAVCAEIEQLGGVAAHAQADVADADALEAAATALERTLGPLDVWVNCAGNGTFGRFLDTPAEDFRRVTEATYLGTVNGTRAALRRMMPRDRGCVVNVCSAVAFHGMPLLSSYCGAKHAVRGFGQSVRAELAQERSRVRLATVFPPAVNTPFFDHAPSYMRRPGRPIPPIYQPEVVADAILLAALGRSGDMAITATASLFAIAARAAPALVRRAIHRLGYGGQLAEDSAALARHAPTLYAPADHPAPARGGFDAGSRSASTHIRLLRLLARWRGGHQEPRPARPALQQATALPAETPLRAP